MSEQNKQNKKAEDIGKQQMNGQNNKQKSKGKGEANGNGHSSGSSSSNDRYVEVDQIFALAFHLSQNLNNEILLLYFTV